MASPITPTWVSLLFSGGLAVIYIMLSAVACNHDKDTISSELAAVVLVIGFFLLMQLLSWFSNMFL